MLRLDSITPLGKPVVPDVYCMLITSSTPTRGGARVERRVRTPARRARAAPRTAMKPGGVSLADEDHAARSAGMSPRVAPICVERGDVVDVAEAADRDERRGLALAQQVVDVARAQRRVGGDEDGADLRERELQHDPLGHVGRPDDDALARLDAERHQPARDRARLRARARRRCSAAAPRRRAPRASGSAAREARQQIADGDVAVGRRWCIHGAAGIVPQERVL